MKKTNLKSKFSPFYVDVDGENLRYSSTGTRLLLTLLGILLDEQFSTILIDEPEIGLSPRIQASVARFLYDEDQRKEFCPHIIQLFVATHSHLFLDRSIFSNNHTLTKTAGRVDVRPIASVGEFHHLQFAMLGNELESLFLPSAIVLVEGDSDVVFLTKILQLHVPDRKVAIVRAGGDGEILNKLNVLGDALGKLEISPYRDRLFVVLDAKHSARISRIQRHGVQNENIFVWSKNGIEYFYPQDLVAAEFHCDEKELSAINFEADPIKFNEITKSKKELAQSVTDRMTATHALNGEISDFVARVRNACG